MAQKKSIKTEVSTPVVEEIKVKKVGIGSRIIEMLLAHPEMTNKEILDKILALDLSKNKTRPTSYACIAWYKSDLRKKGLIGPRVFAKKAKTEAVTAE
jgi:hypothetical protein